MLSSRLNRNLYSSICDIEQSLYIYETGFVLPPPPKRRYKILNISNIATAQFTWRMITTKHQHHVHTIPLTKLTNAGSLNTKYRTEAPMLPIRKKWWNPPLASKSYHHILHHILPYLRWVARTPQFPHLSARASSFSTKARLSHVSCWPWGLHCFLRITHLFRALSYCAHD